MNIILSDNSAGGFGSTIAAPDGQTVRDFFAANCPGYSEADYIMRVNGNPITPDFVLYNGYHFTVTPYALFASSGVTQIVGKANA